MAVPAELARDSSVAGPIGSLALSVVRPHAASMALRALRWHRDLDRLGVRVPLCLVHDLGLLLASSNEQLSLGPRTDGAQVLTQSGEDPRVFDQYSALISDVAASEAAQRSRTLRLSDDIVVVLLARLLGTVAARIPTAAAYVNGVPYDASLLEAVEAQLPSLFTSVRRTFDVRALIELVKARLFVLTLIDALDLDTLQLFGMLGGNASEGALTQVDILAALDAPEANDVVDFSLEILPSVLETKTRPGASTYSAFGYAGLARKGSIDSLVLTELAWDEAELMRRMADDEVLYYSREQARDDASRLHHVLIDASASMRGERATFARGMAIAVSKKLLLSGEDVCFRFFDSRLYEAQSARGGQLPIAYLLSFKGEHGRNPVRVFADFQRSLELQSARDVREPVVHLFTHGSLYIPRETVAAIAARAKISGVFMMPSGGRLNLDYLDLLATHYVVDQASLGSGSERKREAHRILDDSVPRTPVQPVVDDKSMHGAAPDSTRWRRSAVRHG
ncbi:MAG TPA: hypothetical protein PKA88_08045 [Polyangiaceae bacterium]|nr:hypothetical protein [Polyangiaceae bacterium]